MTGVEVSGSQSVAAELRHRRFTAADEGSLQVAIGAVLDAAFPGEFTREYSLNRRDRPDFFAVSCGLVIEVKWGPSGGSVEKVVSQIARYVEHSIVREVLLVTPSRRVASRIPPVMNGIQVRSVVLTTGL